MSRTMRVSISGEYNNYSWIDEDARESYSIYVAECSTGLIEKFMKFLKTEAEAELKKDNISDAMEMLGALKEMKKDYPETLKRVAEQKKMYEEEKALQEAEEESI